MYQIGRFCENAKKGEQEKYGQFTRPRLVDDLPMDKVIVDISAGTEHNLALSEAQKVYSWGYGMMGELGLGVNEIGNKRIANEVPL